MASFVNFCVKKLPKEIFTLIQLFHCQLEFIFIGYDNVFMLMNRYRIVDVCEHLTFRYLVSVKMYSCGCGPMAHKGLKSPKRFTNLSKINTDIGLNCES